MEHLDRITEFCPLLSVDANYWLVRTNSGQLYKPFREYGLVAIGYPAIDTAELQKAVAGDSSNAFDAIRAIAEKKYPEHNRPGFIASQLKRFAVDLKEGDFVLIPASSSAVFSIGQVISTSIEDKLLFDGDSPIPDFRKTRRVKWYCESRRWDVNPHLFGLFNTQQTLSDANAYATWIDSILYDFYAKGGEYHLVLDIRSENKLNARALFRSFLELLDVADQLCMDFGVQEDTNDVETRINLSSPGKLELIAKTAVPIFLVGAIIIAINGGSAKIKVGRLGLDSELTTRGIVENVNRFLNSQQDRELKQHLVEQLDSLVISSPEQVARILQQINEVNQNE